jgi:hypothetical protein
MFVALCFIVLLTINCYVLWSSCNQIGLNVMGSMLAICLWCSCDLFVWKLNSDFLGISLLSKGIMVK